MDIVTLVTLGVIISAFLLFAGALAYADHATRQVRRAREAAKAKGQDDTIAGNYREAA